MSKPFSIYLDLLRLVAALLVLLGHSHGYILPAMPKTLASHADEGVAIFFVLSGFMMRFVTDTKEKTWQSYASARFLRMVSVVPIALITTAVLDFIGYQINAADYASNTRFTPIGIENTLRALTFTCENWFQRSNFGSNQAYWSLGFEVPYYILFGIITFCNRKTAVGLFIVWALFYGPAIFYYFPMWYMGALTYTFSKNARQLNLISALLVFGASLILYCVIKLGFSDYKVRMPYFRGWDALPGGLAYFYSIAVVVAANIVSARVIVLNATRVRSLLIFCGPAIKWTAGGSFTLYLVHQPVLTFIRAAYPGIRENWSIGLLGILIALLVCYALAEIGERRKKLYRCIFDIFLPSGARRAKSG